MCELLAMSSLRPARLTFSLETLAAHGSPGGRQRDGWGAAFYQGADAALFREPNAAGDSALVRFLESGGPSTTLAISHIRRATRGEVSLANTQPFLREMAGHAQVFAHNGDLPGVEPAMQPAPTHYRPMGTTDSELAFCALLERMAALWKLASAVPTLSERLAVVAQFAAELRKLGPANFLYADGETLFVHGHRRIQASGKIEPPGLHVLSRQCAEGGESLHCHGVSVCPGFQQVTLVASVPLTAEDWRPLAEGEVLAIASGKVLDGCTN
jgi:predicted glutamine amidotransferase